MPLPPTLIDKLQTERVYVTCPDCSDQGGENDLYDGFSIADGRRVARKHTRDTDHDTYIEQTVSFSCELDKS